MKGQIGLENHPDEYIRKLVEIFREVKRILKDTGSLYINLGDTFCGSCSGGGEKNDKTKIGRETKLYKKAYPQGKIIYRAAWLKPKQLMLIPTRVAIALQNDGWILRNDIIWHKPNPMPSSVKDRLNTTYEHIFHFVKQKRYFYDLDAIRVPHKTASLKRTTNNWHGTRPKGSSWYGMDIKKMCHPKGKNPGDILQK